MKLAILILAFVVVAAARPQQGLGLIDLEDLPLQNEQNEVRQESNPTDLLQALLRAGSSRQSAAPRQSRQGGEANLLRVLLSLFGNELGLGSLGGRADGIDQEAFIANLIRIFTSIVGNVLLN